MARGNRNPDKEQFWRNVLEQWRRSGQSIRAFCVDHCLSEPSFHAWRRTIADRDRPTPSPTTEPCFVPIHVACVSATSAIELVVGAGRVVRVAPGFDPDTLRHLLAVLETPSC